MEQKKSSDIAATISDKTFDIDSDSLKKIGYESVDCITDYFKNISDAPILSDKKLSEMQDIFNEELPYTGLDPGHVLAECKKKIIDHAVKVGNPRFLGWITTSATPIGAFSEGIAGAINQSVAISGSSMATAVELQVLRWIKEIIGYEKNSAGILVSGGSVANLIALTIARNTKADFDVCKKGMPHGNNMILYTSEEIHMCITKAVNVLGIGTENIRSIKINDNRCMDIEDLREKIKKDKENGMHPFAVVATAGTVSTGSIDPLDNIADICEEYDLWFHVDAAYGGFAALSSKFKPLLSGIDRADSIALDPHKWLYVPFEAGCLLVKNPAHMTQTFSMKTDYIHTDNTKIPSFEDVDFSDYGIQLTRSFRALKIWMTLKQYGIKKYEELIEQNINLAKYMGALIEESDDFELSFPVKLSIVCFRYIPTDLKTEISEEYLNKLNQAIIHAMRKDRRAYVSSTIIDDKFVLRACIVNHRTTKQNIIEILDIIRELAAKLEQ